ncbi:MAG: adenylate kinase [Clostridiales bacterium]|nr:adenylate kinase [Clostridiales bacterium]
MNKVIVIGCPGAGKSTFARELRDRTALPLYYLDMLWHKPDRTNIAREEFDAGLQAIMAKERWIIDGNYGRTMEMRLKACDTVFFLDYPLALCLAGAEERVGKPREDMPWMETEFDEEFKQCILDFEKDQRPKIMDLLARYQKEKKIVVFHSREEADHYLTSFFNNKKDA